MSLDDAELERYARHIILKEVGGAGQKRLKAARVLIIGAGGLGSPVALYLAAAGVGTLGLVDDDLVSLSNLQRQILHGTDQIGRLKVDSGKDMLARINPAVTVETHACRLTPENSAALFSRYDLIADGSDNFPTRFLVADTALVTGRTLVSGALGQFEGQVATFKGKPCYRCLYPNPPPDGSVRSCAEAGILGAVAGVIGTLQAVEVLKEILGLGEGLAGRLLLYDALGTTARTIRLKPDPACPACSEGARLTEIGPDWQPVMAPLGL